MKYQISVFRDTVQRNRYSVWTGETSEGSNNPISQEIPSDKFLDYLKGFEIQSLKFYFLESYIRFDKEFSKIVYFFEIENIEMVKEIEDSEMIDKLIKNHIIRFIRGEGVYLTIFAK